MWCGLLGYFIGSEKVIDYGLKETHFTDDSLKDGGLKEKFYKDRLWFSVNHFNSADKLKDGWE